MVSTSKLEAGEQSSEAVSPRVGEEDLSSYLSSITALICREKKPCAEALRHACRSRLARQVLQLPDSASTALVGTATSDLPVASLALALGSASLTVNHARARRFLPAVQAADVAMVFLGMPEAAPLVKFVAFVERTGLLELGENSIATGRIGEVQIIEADAAAPKLRSPCQEICAPDLSLKQFSELFQHDQPLIIRGCAAEWPALKKWPEASYLSKLFGHRTVPVESITVGKVEMEERFYSLNDVLRMMLVTSGKKEESVYIAQHPLFDYIPALQHDIAHPKYMHVVGKSRADLVNIWMGTPGSGSKLHYDSADNFLVQVVGEKKVVLIPPAQSNLLYRKSATANVSPVDVGKPDLTTFPLFERVEAVTAILRPGDALYIPAMHWHWVTAFSASVSVNFWF